MFNGEDSVLAHQHCNPGIFYLIDSSKCGLNFLEELRIHGVVGIESAHGDLDDLALINLLHLEILVRHEWCHYA